MTTYKIYWKTSNGYTGYTYIEVSDSYGRRKAAKARELFFEMGYGEGCEITRVVKDC